MIELFFFGIGFILLGGIAALFLSEKLKGIVYSVFSLIGTTLIVISSMGILLFGGQISFSVQLSSPIGEVILVIDALSSFFVLLISVISLIGSVYSIGYMKHYFGKSKSIGINYFLIGIFVSSMLLVVTVQNAIAFLIVWEIMTLSSYFLMMFENEKPEVLKAGLIYLVMMHIGVVFLIVSFITLYFKSGSLNFDDFRTILNSDVQFASLMFILFFIGFGTKAGFVPFHIPKTYPYEPNNISGMMSGAMIKTGIYGILRLILLIGTPSVGLSYFVLIFSIITAIYGVIYAISEKDIKKILAYSSIENIGIIGIGIGIGMLGLSITNRSMAIFGFAGAILHTLNHSLFKSLLFYGAGVVYLRTGTNNIECLGGLTKPLRNISLFFLIGSVSICALPPFNGFISEFLIYLGLLNGASVSETLLPIVSIISIAMLSLVGAIVLIAFTRVYSVTFLGSPRSKYDENISNPIPNSITFSLLILSILMVLIGFLPKQIINVIKMPIALLVNNSDTIISVDVGIVEILRNVSIGIFLFIGILILVYFLRNLSLRKKSLSEFKTWDCGYQAGNNRMQYSAKSYSKPFLNLVSHFTIWKEKKQLPEELFPKQAKDESESKDIIERFIVEPLSKGISFLLNGLSWIQGGHSQRYILYGLLFLIIAIILVIVGVM
jgi:formate hydrogenlyase subunit 3/multisubunit Na+/H+ antiporter MnhD subunit